MSAHEIRKQVLLKSSLDRVWRALTDSNEFGSWFGMKLDGPFRAGSSIQGVISPTTVDDEVAKMQKPYAGTPTEFSVSRLDANARVFALKWHPFAIDPAIDYSKEPMTEVTFSLQEKADGVLLTIVESGFENIPASRREAAFKANDGGWQKQTELITKYLAKSPRA